VLWAQEIPQNDRVSGHVYDLGSGLVTTNRRRQKQEVRNRETARACGMPKRSAPRPPTSPGPPGMPAACRTGPARR